MNYVGFFLYLSQIKREREMGLVDNIRFFPFYIVSNIELCSMLLTFSIEALTSKIIWAQTVGIGAESSVTRKHCQY